jgi:hypothetical protein
LITELQDSNKAMVCTHKIKREERVWIFKTEKNGMDVIVFFCFKNPYPFHNHPTIKEHSLIGKRQEVFALFL